MRDVGVLLRRMGAGGGSARRFMGLLGREGVRMHCMGDSSDYRRTEQIDAFTHKRSGLDPPLPQSDRPRDS